MLKYWEAIAQDRGGDYYTVEHFTPKLFGYCCNLCNIYRQPLLREWFKTPYCLTRNINEDTIAEVVREWLRLEEEITAWQKFHGIAGGWDYASADLTIQCMKPLCFLGPDVAKRFILFRD